MHKLSALLLSTLMLAACHRHGPVRTYSVNPGTDSSITFDVSSDSASKTTFVFPDTLVLRMDSTSRITWADGKVIRMTALQQELQDSLMAIFLHTQKLPSRLTVQYLGTVTMGIRGIADDQIRQAQIVLRNVVTAKTLGQSYGRLDAKERAAFKKKYPALFGRYY